MAAYLGLSNTQKIIKFDQLQVSTSLLDVGIPLFWGQKRLQTNCVWYNDFTAEPANGKGKGGKNNGPYDYTASVILALGEGVIDEVLNVWLNGSTQTAVSLAESHFGFMSGTASQAPWSYVVSQYPAQALAYENTAYVYQAHCDLGQSASVPNHAFECRRLNGFTDVLTSTGWTNPTTEVMTPGMDVSLCDVIPDLLTSPQYGLGFSSGDIGSMSGASGYRAYQDGQGFYFSPALINQEKAVDIIDRWAQLSNTWIYWNGTQVQFVPLGDSPVGSYVPDLTPAYNLSSNNANGTSDFLGDVPIKVTRADPADCYNLTKLEICDRTRGYISNPIEYKDQTLTDLFGIRDSSSTQADDVTVPTIGQMCAQLIGKRAAYIRKTYTFKTSYRYVLLIPGSIVTLTDVNTGLDEELVRVRTVEEAENGDLSFLCEELPIGIGTYYPYNFQTTPVTQTTPAFNVDPGPVNTPAIIEPPPSLTNGQPSVVIAASGGVNWAGGLVYISFDNVNYTQIGDITARAPQGVLTASLPSYTGTNPDVTNSLDVDCTESVSTPPAGITHADAQFARTLSVVAAQPTLTAGVNVMPTAYEMLAFGAATATGTYAADLTYLYRNLDGTGPMAHSSGDQFTTIDITGSHGTTVVYALPVEYIGQTIYVKIASYNFFSKGQLEDISTLTPYSYTPTGSGYGGGGGGVPTVPTGLAAAGGVGQNIVTWNPNPASDNVTGYTLYAAPGLSQPFSSAVEIWSGNATSYTQTGLASGAQTTYFLTAQNVVGSSGHTAGVNCTSSTITYAARLVASTPGRKPLAGEVIFSVDMKTGDALASGLPGALLTCDVAPMANWTVTLTKNAVTIGTGTILASATSGSFSFASGVSFADGDSWNGAAPGTQDATLSGVRMTYLFTRTQ